MGNGERRKGGVLSLLTVVCWMSALPAPVQSANVLLVTGAASISTTESARQTQFQTWGHTVTTIEDNASQASFNTAMASADVVYIPMTIQEWELGTKVKSTTDGVVCEERYLDVEMGFSTTDGWNANHNNTEILVNSHAVTSGLSTGYVTIVGSTQELAIMNATLASGMTVLSKQNYSAGNMLGVIDTGGALAGGGTAAGRRVRMPWGGDNFAWSALNSNGLLIAQQAIAWAANTNKLVLHWKLNETSGSVAADASSFANDGAYTNSPTLAVPAPRNFGASFSTGTQHVYRSATTSLNAIGAGNADFTAAFWVKPGAPAGVYRPLFHKGSTDSERGPGVWLQPSDNGLHCRISTTANSNEGLNSIASLPTGVWSHVTLIKSGSAWRCYINGVLDSSTTLSGTTTGNSGPLYVGDDPWYPGSGCAMDDVRIYNYALSDTEIAEVHGLIAHWKLDDAGGSDAQDSTLAGNDAELTGTQNWTTGVEGGAFDFDYANGEDYFEAPSTTALDDVHEEDYTVMAYVKPNSVPPGTGSANDAAYAIVSKQGYHIGLIYNSAGGFAMEHWIGSPLSWVGASSAESYPPDRFYHVAGVVSRTNGTVQLYVDGVLVGTSAFTPGTAALELGSSQWRIGVSGPGATEWGHAADAVVDDARIYNRALSAEELAEYTNPGLVAYWKFDETNGTNIADSSGNGNDASFETGTPTWVAGVRGNALQFDGSNDAQTIADFDPPAIGSVAFWCRFNAEPASSQRLFGLGGDWEVRVDTADVLYMDLGTDGAGGFQSPHGYSKVGVWHYVVAVYNDSSNTYKLYLDGKLAASGSKTIVPQSSGLLSFGTRTGSTQRFDGALDDLRVYNYELSEAEIAELYGLVGHWMFDEGAGTVVADSSGAGADAAFANGTPAWVNGVRGYALQFDGSSDAITDEPFDPPASGAVAFWVRRDAAQTDQERPFGLGGDWEARQETTGVMAFDLGTSPFAGQPTFETTEVFPGIGQWRHVVAQYDADTDAWELYVDGQLDGAGPHTRDILAQAAARLSFGARTGSTQFFKGSLDDFRVYNRWLQPQEIADLYGLVGHWKLGENSGTVAIDSSYNAQNGTYYGIELGQPGPTIDLPLAARFPFGGIVGISSHTKFKMRESLGVAFWMKLNAISESWHPLGWEETPSSDAYRFDMSDDKSWGLELNPGDSVSGGIGSDSLFANAAPTGVWTHFAASFSGTEIVLYRNGVEVASKPSSGVTVGESFTELFLGYQPSGGVDAEMADFRLYNRAFFPGEARQLYYGEWTPGVRIIEWAEVR